MTTMTELPFDYDDAYQRLRHMFRRADDADTEDQYHDCIEKFLVHWNGIGDPVGALSMYWRQWYKDKNYRKKLQLVSLLINEAEDDDEVMYHDVELPDDSLGDVLISELYKVLSTCTSRQIDIFVRRMNDESFKDIGDSYGISHQAVMDSYSKLTKKILDILK